MLLVATRSTSIIIYPWGETPPARFTPVGWSLMPRAIVGEIELEYETIGAQDDPAILSLVIDLGAQAHSLA